MGRKDNDHERIEALEREVELDRVRLRTTWRVLTIIGMFLVGLFTSCGALIQAIVSLINTFYHRK